MVAAAAAAFVGVRDTRASGGAAAAFVMLGVVAAAFWVVVVVVALALLGVTVAMLRVAVVAFVMAEDLEQWHSPFSLPCSLMLLSSFRYVDESLPSSAPAVVKTVTSLLGSMVLLLKFGRNTRVVFLSLFRVVFLRAKKFSTNFWFLGNPIRKPVNVATTPQGTHHTR